MNPRTTRNPTGGLLLRAATFACVLAAVLTLTGCDALPDAVTDMLPGNGESVTDDARLAVVADYFRALVAVDTAALADTVVTDARGYLETPGLQRVATSAPGEIVDEVWDAESVTFTIDYPSGVKAYSRLLAPESSTSRTIRYENSNDAGAAYSGTVTVTLEGERWVVDTIDRIPIADVLKKEFSRP